MKPIPPEHKELLGKPFEFGCAMLTFTSSEISILQRYGAWLAALVEGKIQPFTPLQTQFIRCVQNNLEPRTEFERVYLKMRARREYEAECLGRPIYHVVDPGHEWFPWQRWSRD
jgi:hypothetical protein